MGNAYAQYGQSWQLVLEDLCHQAQHWRPNIDQYSLLQINPTVRRYLHA